MAAGVAREACYVMERRWVVMEQRGREAQRSCEGDASAPVPPRHERGAREQGRMTVMMFLNGWFTWCVHDGRVRVPLGVCESSVLVCL